MQNLDDTGKPISFLTEQIILFIEHNELNIDDDDDFDILNAYLKDRFNITISKEAIIKRLSRIS